MGKEQANETVGRLIAYWQFHRHFDANMADLARYARVSRGSTVYTAGWAEMPTPEEANSS